MKSNLPKKNIKIRKQKKSSVPEIKDINNLIKEDWVQDWIPIEEVRGGMFKLKKSYGGGYVSVLEVEPTNFMMFDADERESLLTEMSEWLHVCPVSFQFQMMTNRSNADELIRYIKKETNDETGRVLFRRNLYIKKIRELSSTEALRKRFFIIMKYEGRKTDDIQEVFSVMQSTKGTVAYYFNRMGNAVVNHDDENSFLVELLYQHFNPSSYERDPINKRVSRVVDDYEYSYYDIHQESLEDRGMIPIADYIAPRGFDTSNREYVVVDGMFMTFLYIRADGYRSFVYPGWMEDITNFGEGTDINIYIKKRSREQVEAEAKRTSNIKSADTNLADRRDRAKEALGAALNADMIHDAIVENNEDLFDVVTLMSIKSTSLKELMKKKDDIITYLRSKSYQVGECFQHNEKAFLMSLPLLLKDPQISEKASRNFLTSSLASMYFFTAFELNDKNGSLLGINASNSTIAVMNFFNSQKYKNANSIILGTSGMGKTYMLQQLGYSLRLSGISVSYILPYKGKKEYGQACKAIDGEFISLAPGSKACINVMAIRPQVKADESLIDEDEDNSLLQSKIHKVITFVQLLKPKQEMTDIEEMQLNVVCTKLYEEFGITDDNDSIWEDKDNHILKRMPIVGDLYDKCMEDEILCQRVAVALRAFVEGTCRNLNGQTNVNLDNKYIIYDVSNAGDMFLPAFAFIATDCAYDKIKGDRTENNVIIMDEVWKMMVNEYCAQYVRDMYKIIRGYGGAAISATQDISDFLSFHGGEYGKKIISNSRIKFILGMEKNEAELIADVVGVGDAEVKRIRKYDRGQVLMVANGEKVPINIKGTEEETCIFTTDAQKIKELEPYKRKLIDKNPEYYKDVFPDVAKK